MNAREQRAQVREELVKGERAELRKTYAHFITDRRLVDIRDHLNCVFLHSGTLVPKHSNRFRRLKDRSRWAMPRSWSFLNSPVCPERRSSRAQTRPIRTPGRVWAARLFCGLPPLGFLCRTDCTWTRDSRCRTCRFRPTWFGNDQRWAEVPAHTSSWQPIISTSVRAKPLSESWCLGVWSFLL